MDSLHERLHEEIKSIPTIVQHASEKQIVEETIMDFKSNGKSTEDIMAALASKGIVRTYGTICGIMKRMRNAGVFVPGNYRDTSPGLDAFILDGVHKEQNAREIADTINETHKIHKKYHCDAIHIKNRLRYINQQVENGMPRNVKKLPANTISLYNIIYDSIKMQGKFTIYSNNSPNNEKSNVQYISSGSGESHSDDELAIADTDDEIASSVSDTEASNKQKREKRKRDEECSNLTCKLFKEDMIKEIESILRRVDVISKEGVDMQNKLDAMVTYYAARLRK